MDPGRGHTGRVPFDAPRCRRLAWRMHVSFALFADAAIPAETRQMNAALIQMMSGVPSWFEVGAPVVRELRLKGGSVFPPPVFSPRAKTIAVPGPAGPVSCRVITPEAAGAPQSGQKMMSSGGVRPRG